MSVRERLLDVCLEQWPSSYGEIIDTLMKAPGIAIIEVPEDVDGLIERAENFCATSSSQAAATLVPDLVAALKAARAEAAA